MAVPEHYLRRDLEYLQGALFQWCRKLGVPLMSPPRAPEALDALGAEVERLREAEAVLEALVATTDLRDAPQTVKDRIREVIRAKHAR